MKKVNLFYKKGDDKITHIDYGMLISVIMLLCVGLLMVSTASSYYALTNYSDSNYFFVRQLFFAVLGIIFMLFFANVNYKNLKKASGLFYIICLALLFAVAIPGVGSVRNGARRWLEIGGISFQPSEIMKFALILITSTYIANNYKKMNGIKSYIVPILYLIAVMIGMFLQNHMSGMLVMIVASFSIIFVSGIKINWKYLIIFVIIGIVAVTTFIMSSDFRKQRIVAYLHPEEDVTGDNWQVAQSLYAIGSGGIFGRGLGQSRQKYLWLPEAQTDFIFSVLGEEFGIFGSVLVLLMFAFMIYRGFMIAVKCNDAFGSMIVTGIMSVLTFQICVNIAVVTHLMPVTGMPLPFFSYGGTALFINLCAIGIILSVSRNCKKS